VLGALQEVETALSNYARAIERRTALQDARNAAARPPPSPAPASAKARSTRWNRSMPSARWPMPRPIWSRPTPRSPNARSICSGRSGGGWQILRPSSWSMTIATSGFCSPTA
jgi:hypothetical protein